MNQPRSAATYLDAAAETADRLGKDGNYCWTGFGPTNVELHRVHTAMEIGDVDQAISQARRVETNRIQLPDRKARFAIDDAAAYASGGCLDDALDALCLAEATAPQELRAIRSVPSTLETIQQSGTQRVRSQAEEISARLEPAA